MQKFSFQLTNSIPPKPLGGRTQITNAKSDSKFGLLLVPLFRAKVTSHWLPLKRTVKPLNVKYRRPGPFTIATKIYEHQIFQHIVLGGECMMTNCSGLERSVEYWMMESRGKFQKTLPRTKHHNSQTIISSGFFEFFNSAGSYIWHTW